MSENSNYDSNSKTLVIETKDFTFETMGQGNGVATVVRFQLLNPEVKPGDVLLVLTGADVHFHGLIGRIDEGWAVATDHHSLLPLPTTIH
ncbi:MAG TPA: hypothetical protein VHP35_16310 [Terriglobia bacterium]|jgi:hypothetical protein|nr:hypothetical protein [Terriglobia bacterium]